MAVGTGVTEIADSEDEPLTSSPADVPDPAVDKLSAVAAQDAQAVACPHQDVAGSTANQTSSRTDLLDVYQKKPSADVEITYFDQPDSQSAHETATDNARACAVETPLQADTAPRAHLHAAGADQQDMCTGTNRADDSPQAKPASGRCERAISQMSQQSHLGDPQDDQQPQLQQLLPITSGIVDVQQDSPSKDCVQGESVASHNATLKPSQCNHAPLATSEQGPGQRDDACADFHKDLEANENNCLAAEPSHSISDEATTTPTDSTHTDHSDVTANPGEIVLDAANVSDPRELVTWPGAADSTPSDASLGQHETAVLPTSQGSVNSIAGVESQYINKTAATSSAPLSGPGLTTAPRNHRASGDASLASTPPVQSKRMNDCNPPSEKYERSDETYVTATQNPESREVASTQGSITASTEQVREEDRPFTESGNVVARQPSETANQSSHDTLQTQYQHDQAVEDDQSSAFKPPEDQTESQFTVSQASELTSPRPAAKLSPQEITLVELRAQKAALLGSLRVQPTIQVIMEETQADDVDMSDNDGEPTEAEITAAANKILKEHIKLLHDYNELKDVGQGLMGLIADQRGVRIAEIQDEFGIDAED